MLKSLFWKEWREQRLIVFLGMLLILLGYSLWLIFGTAKFNFDLIIPLMFCSLVPGFGLFLGASAFSREREEDNLQFLLSLPVSPAKIFWTKYLAGLLLLVSLIIFSFIINVSSHSLSLPSEALRDSLSALLAAIPISLYLFTFAFLLATLRVRALPAVISGFFLGTVFFLLFFPLGITLFGYSLLGGTRFGYSQITSLLPLSYGFSWQFYLYVLFLVLLVLMFAYFFWRKYITGGLAILKAVAITTVAFVAFVSLIYLQLSEEGISLLRQPYYQAKNFLEDRERNWSRLLHCAPIASMLYSSYMTESLQFAYFEARRDLAKIATALKLYKLKRGEYPESLQALVPDCISELPRDTFTGSDFMYRREAKGFLLYSLGENGIDDGGRTSTEREVHAMREKYLDIPWQQLR